MKTMKPKVERQQRKTNTIKNWFFAGIKKFDKLLASREQ